MIVSQIENGSFSAPSSFDGALPFKKSEETYLYIISPSTPWLPSFLLSSSGKKKPRFQLSLPPPPSSPSGSLILFSITRQVVHTLSSHRDLHVYVHILSRESGECPIEFSHVVDR